MAPREPTLLVQYSKINTTPDTKVPEANTTKGARLC